jgi:hypothetical protein
MDMSVKSGREKQSRGLGAGASDILPPLPDFRTGKIERRHLYTIHCYMTLKVFKKLLLLLLREYFRAVVFNLG